MSIGNSVATLLSCCTTPVEESKASSDAQVPDGTIIKLDERLQAMADAGRSGPARFRQSVREQLGAQLCTYRNRWPDDWASTVMTLPSPSGGRVVGLDLRKGGQLDADSKLLLNLADVMLNQRVASFVEPAAHEPDPLQPPAGRTVIERLLAGPLSKTFNIEGATFTISSRPRLERPGLTSGVIDLTVKSEPGKSWRRTASLHALPLRRSSLIAHRVKEAMALGKRHGGALADERIAPGLALIHEGRPQQLAPALAAIGLLREGSSIEQTVEGIRAARKAAHRRVAPRHAGPLPPAPPDPSAARPMTGPAATSGPGCVRLAPSPVIRCPAQRPSASLTKLDPGMRLEPSPVIRMPKPTPTLSPEGRDQLNRRAVEAVSRNPGVNQAVQTSAAQMARPSGLAGWYRRVLHGEKAGPMARLAAKLVRAVDKVLRPDSGEVPARSRN